MRIQVETKLSQPQFEVYNSNSREVLLVAGRRFGKTTLAAYIMRKWAMSQKGLYAYVAPTWRMAKNIFWELFLSIIPKQLMQQYFRNSLEVRLRNGSIVRLYGAQNYDAMRGEGFDGVIVDETKDIPYGAWFEVIRPALSDRKGKAFVIGTPQGRTDLLYEIFTQPNFQKFHYTTIQGGWVSPEEIEQAKAELDERTFRQEFEAEFLDTTGLAYYAFSDENIQEYHWNPASDVYMTWDFNVGQKPMSVILVQQDQHGFYHAFQEFVHINSNTFYTAKVAFDWLKKHNFSGTIFVTGDYAGNRLTSTASKKDYEIIVEIARENGFPVYLKTRPVRSIRNRVAMLNAYFCNSRGERKLFVDPSCKRLIADLRQVVWNENGVTLNDLNPERTHPSDALSYFVWNFSIAKIVEEL